MTDDEKEAVEFFNKEVLTKPERNGHGNTEVMKNVFLHGYRYKLTKYVKMPGDYAQAYDEGMNNILRTHIRKSKAIEVVAKWVYDFWHRSAQEKDIWGDLPTEIQDMHRKRAKQELGIE
jgi:phage-related protein